MHRYRIFEREALIGLVRCCVPALLVAALALPAWAQYPTPRLDSMTPGGAKAGTSVEVIIDGADLDEAKSLEFYQTGLKAERVPDPPPPKPDPKKKNQKPPPPPPLKFKITVAGNVPPGIYDARIVGKWGVSNPRAFVVGDINEVMETEPNDDVPQAQKVNINEVINGKISKTTDVDYYQFTGKKGQKVVLHCAASSIDSRMTPFMQVFNGTRRLGGSWRYDGRDALFSATLPVDGDYLIRLNEHAYLYGDNDFFYRLSISEKPWIDIAYPPVVQAGKATPLTLYGRNLPNGKPDPTARVRRVVLDKATVQVTPPSDASGLTVSGQELPRSGSIDGFHYRIKNNIGLSNPVLLAYATDPVVLDNEQNDDSAKPQQIKVPCELCGRVEKRRDEDWYVFDAKKDEVFVLEGYADRLGSPADMFFEIWRGADKPEDKDKRVGEYDDNPDIPERLGSFYTRTDDPKARLVVPADGKYKVRVSSRTAGNLAGPRYIYRLRIGKEKPDYRLVLVANNEPTVAGCTLRKGSSQDLQVICFRRDGFDGPVTITVDGLPGGLTCPPQIIGQGQKDSYIVITAPGNAPDWTGTINVKGTATIDGKQVVRNARAGAQVWPIPANQRNMSTVSRMSRNIALAVRGDTPYSLGSSVKELSVPVGGEATFKISANRIINDIKKANIKLQPLSDIPNLRYPNVTLAANKNDADVKLQIANNVSPGTYNLVFQGQAQFQYMRDPKTKKKENIIAYQAAPPVTITIYNQVADVSVAPAKIDLKPGDKMNLKVQVKRQHDYKGEFQVQLQLPRGFGGLSAKAVKIPANANEATIEIVAAGNAKAAMSSEVIIRAIGKVGKVSFNHDATFAVNILPPPPKKK